MSNYFRGNTENHSYNTRNSMSLTMPRSMSYSGQRMFIDEDANDYNNIPENIRNEQNFDKYKEAVYS